MRTFYRILVEVCYMIILKAMGRMLYPPRRAGGKRPNNQDRRMLVNISKAMSGRSAADIYRGWIGLDGRRCNPYWANVRYGIYVQM